MKLEFQCLVESPVFSLTMGDIDWVILVCFEEHEVLLWYTITVDWIQIRRPRLHNFEVLFLIIQTALWCYLVFFPAIKTVILRIISGIMERFQNVEWKDDITLCDNLRNYVLQNYLRQEILDFMKQDYSQYSYGGIINLAFTSDIYWFEQDISYTSIVGVLQ